jgi:hypothetical protein
MKKIIVRKTLKYDPTLGGTYSKYDGYCLITGRIADPGIVVGQKLICENNVKKIFCAPDTRSRESVKNGVVVAELREVKFDLKKLVSEGEYEKFGSELVRLRFLEMFVKDELVENRKEIKQRIDSLINQIMKLSDGKYLVVSHSFFMKILEAYLQEKDVFEKPEKLSGYLNPQQRTYNFGEGFEFEI